MEAISFSAQHMESIETCVGWLRFLSPPLLLVSFFFPSLARHAVSVLLDAVLDLPLFPVHVHLLLVILRSAECQEMTESHSEHSWTDPAAAGREGAGTLVRYWKAEGRSRFLGAMAWLKSLVLLLSQWEGLWGSSVSLPFSLVSVFGVDLLPEGAQGYLFPLFSNGILFPGNQGG